MGQDVLMREPKNQLKPTGSYPADMSAGGQRKQRRPVVESYPALSRLVSGCISRWHSARGQIGELITAAVEIITSVLLTNAPPPIEDLPIPLE